MHLVNLYHKKSRKLSKHFKTLAVKHMHKNCNQPVELNPTILLVLASLNMKLKSVNHASAAGGEGLGDMG